MTISCAAKDLHTKTPSKYDMQGSMHTGPKMIDNLARLCIKPNPCVCRCKMQHSESTNPVSPTSIQQLKLKTFIVIYVYWLEYILECVVFILLGHEIEAHKHIMVGFFVNWMQLELYQLNYNLMEGGFQFSSRTSQCLWQQIKCWESTLKKSH